MLEGKIGRNPAYNLEGFISDIKNKESSNIRLLFLMA